MRISFVRFPVDANKEKAKYCVCSQNMLGIKRLSLREPVKLQSVERWCIANFWIHRGTHTPKNIHTATTHTVGRSGSRYRIGAYRLAHVLLPHKRCSVVDANAKRIGWLWFNGTFLGLSCTASKREFSYRLNTRSRARWRRNTTPKTRSRETRRRRRMKKRKRADTKLHRHQ